MADNLQFWRKVEWLSIYDAALLLCDVNPSTKFASNKHDMEILELEGEFYSVGMPEAFESAKALLLNHVKADQKFSSENNDDGVLFKEIKFREDIVSDEINAITEIRMVDVVAWFVKNDFESDFFSVQADNLGHKKNLAKPEYQTELMTIMYETIKRYYGEQYDPDDRDTVSRQDNVVSWLKKEYALSGAQAKAIDKMTRPHRATSPNGKK